MDTRGNHDDELTPKIVWVTPGFKKTACWTNKKLIDPTEPMNTSRVKSDHADDDATITSIVSKPCSLALLGAASVNKD